MTLLLYVLAAIGTAACAFTSYLWFRIDREKQIHDGLLGSAIRARLECVACRVGSDTPISWPYEIEQEDQHFINQHRLCRDGGQGARAHLRTAEAK